MNVLMAKMGLAASPACACGAEEQTMQHIVEECQPFDCSGDFASVDALGRDWIHQSDIEF